MSHPILVRADGESSRALRDLIAGHLPTGFEEAGTDPTKGLNVDPVSVALIAAGGALVSSLITSLTSIWVARIQAKAKEAPPNRPQIATVTIATHSDDIVIRVEPDAKAAIARAQLPDDPADILEIRLGVG